MVERDDPCFVISVAARLVNMHPQTLRHYERLGLIEPSRSSGNIRLYSAEDIARLRQINRLINDLGVNLAGVEVIMRLKKHLEDMEREILRLRALLEQHGIHPGDDSRSSPAHAEHPGPAEHQPREQTIT